MSEIIKDSRGKSWRILEMDEANHKRIFGVVQDMFQILKAKCDSAEEAHLVCRIMITALEKGCGVQEATVMDLSKGKPQ